MEFKGSGQSGQSNNNRVSQPRVPASATEGGKPINMMRESSNKKWMIIAGVIVAALLVMCLGWMGWNRFVNADGVKKAQYQAIFLTNGQVYFGKLTNVNDKYVSLTDVYYLQVQQSSTVQPADNKTTDQNPQVSLAKLGNELHGPDDQMAINRDQVLFWENLKDSGKVVDAIKKNQQQK